MCSGHHDEITIQKVLDALNGTEEHNCVVEFAEGTYHIDGFHSRSDAQMPTAMLIGQNRSLVFKGEVDISQMSAVGAQFVISPQAYDATAVPVRSQLLPECGCSSCAGTERSGRSSRVENPLKKR